jgi:hypothetical protein
MGFATALTAGGVGMQVGSRLYAGRVAEAQSEYEASVYEQEAKMRKQKTEFDLLQAERAKRRGMGRLRAKLATGGARLDVGAPLLALSEQAAEYELKKALTAYEGEIETQRLLTKKELAESRGKYARRASYIQAGASLLTGFATMHREGMFGGGSNNGSAVFEG